MGTLGDFGAAPLDAAGLIGLAAVSLDAAGFTPLTLTLTPDFTAGLAAVPFDAADWTASPSKAAGLSNATGSAIAAAALDIVNLAAAPPVAAGLTARTAPPPAADFAENPNEGFEIIIASVSENTEHLTRESFHALG